MLCVSFYFLELQARRNLYCFLSADTVSVRSRSCEVDNLNSAELNKNTKLSDRAIDYGFDYTESYLPLLALQYTRILKIVRVENIVRVRK